MLIGPDSARFTNASASGSLLDAAIYNSSHIYASPQEEVAVRLLAPAASAPIAALMELCSLSTGMNSVSTCPFATKDAKYCGISVDGVIGNAGNTSGLICLRAIATASFPDNTSPLPL